VVAETTQVPAQLVAVQAVVVVLVAAETLEVLIQLAVVIVAVIVVQTVVETPPEVLVQTAAPFVLYVVV
jgi:hypothetical protein